MLERGQNFGDADDDEDNQSEEDSNQSEEDTKIKKSKDTKKIADAVH